MSRNWSVLLDLNGIKQMKHETHTGDKPNFMEYPITDKKKLYDPRTLCYLFCFLSPRNLTSNG